MCSTCPCINIACNNFNTHYFFAVNFSLHWELCIPYWVVILFSDPTPSQPPKGVFLTALCSSLPLFLWSRRPQKPSPLSYGRESLGRDSSSHRTANIGYIYTNSRAPTQKFWSTTSYISTTVLQINPLIYWLVMGWWSHFDRWSMYTDPHPARHNQARRNR